MASKTTKKVTNIEKSAKKKNRKCVQNIFKNTQKRVNFDPERQPVHGRLEDNTRVKHADSVAQPHLIHTVVGMCLHASEKCSNTGRDNEH